jgi:multicomponent Na+:H+ antiporter subunit A
VIELLALHAVVGLGLFAAGARLGRRAFAVAAIAPAAAIAWLVWHRQSIVGGEPYTQEVSWVPRLDLAVSIRVDGFSLLMIAAVSGIGLAVLLYSAFYFGGGGLHRWAGLLTMFAGAMLGIVVADDVFILFTAWELTSITSYLLIGNEHTKAQARAAALQALLITSAGGLVLLAGLVLVAQAAGTSSMSAILADPPRGTTVTAGLTCIVVGAFTKSAQYPFHSWLPGAMAAPTPVSAYLHSATMVKAGVYLIARFAPVCAATTAGWRPLVLGAGSLTMICGGLRALRQYDLKLLLAYGTLSQLGLMVVLFGAGTPGMTVAGVLVLIAHIVFKCALFMVVGVIDHQTGTRDIRLIPPLGRGWRATKVAAITGAASMAGIPLMAGFIAKEASLDAVHEARFPGAQLELAVIVVGTALTVAYSARFLWGVLLLPRRLRAGTESVSVPHPDAAAAGDSAPRPARWFVAPAVILGAFSVLAGVVPGVLDRPVDAAADALDPAAPAVHLEIWHGVNIELILTVVAFSLGLTLFALRRQIAPILRLGERIPNGTVAYGATLNGLNIAANRVTAVVQNGTLPIYVAIVLITAAVLPGWTLLTATDLGDIDWIIGPGAQIPISLLMAVAALTAAAIRRRFTAVLFLSVVGYGMAATFVVHGAPDLALTQAAVETVTTVLFVLVLRKLPDRFERRSTARTRALRLSIAVTVALTVFFLAIIPRQLRTATPVSDTMLEMSVPEGKGHNAVNVILVDFRGFDTLGELTVLAAAAIGAVALARAGRRRAHRKEPAS